MLPGDLYWADVPFTNRPGGKTRPILILVVNSEAHDVELILEGTSKAFKNQDLVKVIDFSKRGYLGMRAQGITYFYLGGLRNDIHAADLKTKIGTMPRADFLEVMKKLKLKGQE